MVSGRKHFVHSVISHKVPRVLLGSPKKIKGVIQGDVLTMLYITEFKQESEFLITGVFSASAIFNAQSIFR